MKNVEVNEKEPAIKNIGIVGGFTVVDANISTECISLLNYAFLSLFLLGWLCENDINLGESLSMGGPTSICCAY